jgi:hypothetical protein
MVLRGLSFLYQGWHSEIFESSGLIVLDELVDSPPSHSLFKAAPNGYRSK